MRTGSILSKAKCGIIDLKVGELLINFFVVVEESLEQLDTQTGVQAASSRPDTMHAQLRDTAVNGPHADLGTGHGPNSATAARVIANLEDLQG